MPLLSDAVASSQLTWASHLLLSAMIGVFLGGSHLIEGGVESGSLFPFLPPGYHTERFVSFYIFADSGYFTGPACLQNH